MRRFILLTSILLLGISPLTAQDTEDTAPKQDNSKVIITISPYNYQISDTPYAHPQTLTPKQAYRILSSIYVERGRNVPVLNSEDRMFLARKMVKAFKTLKKTQQLKIVKAWGKELKDGSFHEDHSIHLYLCFPDPDTLYVALSYTKTKPDNMYHLACGRFMKWMKDKDGKPRLYIILMDKSLWTTNFKHQVFKVDMDFDPNKIKKEIDSHADKKAGIKEKAETETATLTFEQLENELKRLNDMKDKGLLSDKEYQKARARLMKQAGIGE
ncbi:MAG: SHOCT domain-containing protein [Acidobacteria bacterium]|nr:SHOCT domain-containing protein [Acidobacteriota bacterium]